MDVRRGRIPLGLMLLGLMMMGACGDAESADEDGSTRPLPPAETEMEMEIPEDSAAVEGTPPATAPSRPAPPADPQPVRPPPQSQPGNGGVTSPPPIPVDSRPEREWDPPSMQPRDVRALAAGRTLELRIETGLSTETSKAGDIFHATVAEDVLGNSGEVLLPIGAQVRGRVAESRRSDGADQPAVLELAIESVTVNGAVRPMHATVLEVDVMADTRDSTVETAAKVGAGAAAGAVVGRILGRDTRSTVQGAVVGTVAGTAAAMATRDGHAMIAQGARVVIRLDDRLIVDN